MSNYKTNKITKNIAVIILSVIVFVFLHSEFGLFDFDGNNHSKHDYCEIIKNTSNHTKTLRDELSNLRVEKVFCVPVYDDIESRISQNCFKIIDFHKTLEQNEEIYLLNRSLLI